MVATHCLEGDYGEDEGRLTQRGGGIFFSGEIQTSAGSGLEQTDLPLNLSLL